MKNDKRPAGRPRGSGMKNDEADLVQIADILLANPGMAPTTAMRRLLPAKAFKTDAMAHTAIRRWQSRWKAGADVHMAEARVRAARPKERARTADEVLTEFARRGIPSFSATELNFGLIPTIDPQVIAGLERVSRQMAEIANNPQIAALVERTRAFAEVTQMLAFAEQMKAIAGSPQIRAYQDMVIRMQLNRVTGFPEPRT